MYVNIALRRFLHIEVISLAHQSTVIGGEMIV